MNKRYEISHDDLYWSMTVEIDEEKAKEPIQQMVDFWAFQEDLLEEVGGDYALAFLKQLANKVFYLQMEYDYTTGGIIDLFHKGIEGWTVMDGGKGIEIVSVYPAPISPTQFSVQKLIAEEENE